MVKQVYEQLIESEEYKDYIALLTREKKSEKDILLYIFTHLMLPNEEFINHIEELFMNWDDDGEMMNLLMQNFLQKPHQFNFVEMVSKDKMEFAISLLETTLEKKEVSMELLKPKLKNWDDCPHTKKGETQILHDHTDDTDYEICRSCGLSRKVNLKKSKVKKK